jgi:predicted TIM-barrel fold metal-dependent hydrolase
MTTTDRILATDVLDLDAIPAIDTHGHPFPPDQDVVSSQHLLNAVCVTLQGEAPALNESALLARMVVKGLARVLGCDATWEAAVAARNAAAADGIAQYHRLLFTDANIAMLLVDPGFPLAPTIPAAEFAAVMPCPVREGYRIERFAPHESPRGNGYESFADFHDAFVDRLHDEARRPQTRFLKTVIAYYTGLAIEKVSVDGARRAWDEHASPGDAAEKTLRDYFFWVTALAAREHGLPFQVHTGHTSRMMPWTKVNPILLTPLLNEPELAEVSFVLVHGGYPYCAEAGYMTSAYPNVSLDLSLMIPWASIGAARCIAQTLEFAPTKKVMHGSDGIYVPELYWISAHIARRALARVLGELIDDEVLDRDEAKEVAHDILHRNAERIYGVTIASEDTNLVGSAQS